MKKLLNIVFVKWEKLAGDHESFLSASQKPSGLAPDAMDTPETIGEYKLVGTRKIVKTIKETT